MFYSKVVIEFQKVYCCSKCFFFSSRIIALVKPQYATKWDTYNWRRESRIIIGWREEEGKETQNWRRERERESYNCRLQECYGPHILSQEDIEHPDRRLVVDRKNLVREMQAKIKSIRTSAPIIWLSWNYPTRDVYEDLGPPPNNIVR